MRRARRNAIHENSPEAALVKAIGSEYKSNTEIERGMRSLTIRHHIMPSAYHQHQQREKSPNSPSELALRLDLKLDVTRLNLSTTTHSTPIVNTDRDTYRNTDRDSRLDTYRASEPDDEAELFTPRRDSFRPF